MMINIDRLSIERKKDLERLAFCNKFYENLVERFCREPCYKEVEVFPEDGIRRLIFLHGLGDTGCITAKFIASENLGSLRHGWAEAFKQLKLKHIRCVCPTAPVMPVTLNAGYRMPSWYDIIALTPDGPEDEAGIKKASEMFKELISSQEVPSVKVILLAHLSRRLIVKELISSQEVPSDKVILGGFSQGGALALYTALTMDKQVAGIVGLSTWMPMHKKFTEGMKLNRDIPMFQAHGNIDPLVSPVFGELTSKFLKTTSSKHTYKTYPMMHSSCEEEMVDVKNFLQDLVKE